MNISKKTFVAAIALAIITASSAFADWNFRGIPVNQGNNLLPSNSLNRLNDTGEPFYIDVLDTFDRDGGLGGSEADVLQIGFVPPEDGLPMGELTGSAAFNHGRWSKSSGDYVTSTENGGSVSRMNGQGTAVAHTPWRVAPGLGDYYQLEMTAMVAAGETVSLGYLGDIETYGTSDGLAGSIGQLVLGVERGVGDDADTVTWTVAWDQDGTRQSFSNTIASPAEQELNLQLGWLDGGGDDLFDAWLGTDTSNTRLLQGNMGSAIDVYSVGFELDGGGSWVGSFTAAVPEPAAGMMALMAAGLALGTLRRRK
ncbi:MAG: PEP-CTERM sorting domain-containing protein [Planctomycetota bacterium]